ncbi:MAG: fatty acid desaturase [Deltaproteobacteria bacterium]|nr:fatty acid desaturase [Deltaproteobacteria bacterium]
MPSDFTATEFLRRFTGAFRPRPEIYWSDLLASAGVGWAVFVASTWAPPGSLLHVVATVVAVMLLLRAAIFIHELAHLKRGTLPGFEAAWNLLVGLPFLLPSLMYVGSHGDHHRQTAFGTADDPEYAPMARWGGLRIARFVASMLAVPVLLAVRWGVLGPLSFLVPRLRRLVVERASTLVINTGYRRPAPRGRQAVRWILQETAAAMVFWVVAAGGIAGWISPRWLLQWYIVAAGILLVNQVRTLAAHGYDNDGAQLDSLGQFLDSVTLSGWSIPTALAAPLGLRYHALHHCLPTVPYHSLGALHRRLLAELPLDSPYRRTQRGGILSVVHDLLRQTPREADMLSEDRATGGV